MIEKIIAVLKREIFLIWGDSDLIIMILAAPIFYSLLYASMYMLKMETKIPVSIIDLDRSKLSYELLKDLNSTQMISIKEFLSGFDQAEAKLASEDCKGIIYIPKNYESDIKAGKGTTIKVYLNTLRFLHSNDLNKAINEVILDESNKIRVKIFLNKGYNIKEAEQLSDPLKLNIQMLFNPSETYGDFLIPAILLLIIQQTLLMAIGQSSAKENEYRKLRDLFNRSGNDLLTMLTGKILIYVFVYTAYLLFFFSFNTRLFSVEFYGSRIAFIIAGILGLLCISIVGILTGILFSKKINALVVISLSTYPLFFLSGYSWPFQAMPVLAKILSFLIPTTPLMTVLNRTLQMGGGWENVRFQIIHLLLLITSYFCITVFVLRYKINKEQSLV